MMLSLYKDMKSKAPQNITTEFYVQAIQEGMWQDFVIPARAEFQANGKSKKYTFIKSQVPSILGSCVMKPGSKNKNNIDHLNGLIVIDIDEELTKDQYYAIKEDKYTHILHKSISGVNYCAFIKIEKTKRFKAIFDGIAEYYYKNFNINIDQACSNENRIRFASYDPDIYYNPQSNTFRSTIKVKEPKKKDVNYIFTQSDFDLILQQIKERGIDLCRDDYFRFVRIGMSLANELGEAGRDAFHLICSMGSKYKHEKEDRTYTGFLKRANKESTIGTFYYLCKEEGIDVYSEKTKTIINRVKVSKSQGKPTLDSIKSTLKVANDIDVTKEDEKLIERLILDKNDYSVNANSELSEIEQLENFIKHTYYPKKDIITNIISINENTRLTDVEVNDIYIQCKKEFEFNVSKNDVISILHSNATKKVDVIKYFLKENEGNPTGYIDKYIDAIEPQSEFNRLAFKKWIVGALHNWTSSYDETLVCPLTLVLTGKKHGTGKTSFLRNIMPKELRKYIAESKIDGNDKDSMYTLCTSLLVFDDEFGGKGMKDVKQYKSISDANIITQRRPYGREMETFKRRSILCGTTNESDILKDVTGNRRILPIKVESVDYDLITSMDTTQLIIEAYNLLKDGFDWMIRTSSDIEWLAANTIDNNIILPIEEIFFKFFSVQQQGKYMNPVVMNQGDILNYLSIKTNLRPTKYDIKEIMVKNDLVYKNHRLSKIGNLQKKGVLLYENTDYSNGTEVDDKVPFYF